MTQEDIIRMAREADPKANLSEPYCLDHETRAWLERFAELVAAAERDECACLCDALERTKVYGAKECAEGIRARGQA
jgi:hypothetical protein